MLKGCMTKIHAPYFIWILTLASCAHTPVTIQTETCEFNPSLQKEKSAELLKIAGEDQADRAGSIDSMDWNRLAPRDLSRRIKVASIFAEGCFKSASDYTSAALVFQHGT